MSEEKKVIEFGVEQRKRTLLGDLRMLGVRHENVTINGPRLAQILRWLAGYELLTAKLMSLTLAQMHAEDEVQIKEIGEQYGNAIRDLNMHLTRTTGFTVLPPDESAQEPSTLIIRP